MSPTEIARFVISGKKVLVRAYDAETRHRMMEQFFMGAPPGTSGFVKTNNVIRYRPSGGSVHYAIRDEEVAGMEYHIASGYLTEVMLNRVRLK